MKCRECRGACCETFALQINTIKLSRDEQRWLELHAARVTPSLPLQPTLVFRCRCTMLTSEGACEIWEDRPLICELFIAGSRQCLEAVREQRTKEDYLSIRDEDDPEVIQIEYAGWK